MSYVALVTGRFDEMTRFYGELLGFPVVEQWDRRLRGIVEEAAQVERLGRLRRQRLQARHRDAAPRGAAVI